MDSVEIEINTNNGNQTKNRFISSKQAAFVKISPCTSTNITVSILTKFSRVSFPVYEAGVMSGIPGRDLSTARSNIENTVSSILQTGEIYLTRTLYKWQYRHISLSVYFTLDKQPF